MPKPQGEQHNAEDSPQLLSVFFFPLAMLP